MQPWCNGINMSICHNKVVDELSEQQQQQQHQQEEEDSTVKIVITQSDDDVGDGSNVKLQFEDSVTEENDHHHHQITSEATVESTIERMESGLSSLSTQVVMSESTDIFGTSDTGDMEVEVGKSQDNSTLDESVVELSTVNETINLNETTDSRDSLEDKLSQMEG